MLWSRMNHFRALLNAVLLTKCMRAKLWENSKYVAKQLPGIGNVMATALVNAGVTSFQGLEDMHSRNIELTVNRHPPFGTHVRDKVVHLPKYELTIDQSSIYASHTADITIVVKMTNAETIKANSTADRRHTSVLLVGDADNNVLAKFRISDAVLLSGIWNKKVDIKRAKKGDELSVNLISQDWVGFDVQSTYTPQYSGPKRVSWASSTGQQKVPLPMKQKPSSNITKSNESIPNFQLGFFEDDLDSRESNAVVDMTDRKPCNHKCNNKELCAHECCKLGIPLKGKKVKGVESHLKQMKEILQTMPQTPAGKRLKMATGVVRTPSLSEFAFVKKPATQVSDPTGWEDLHFYEKKREMMRTSALSTPTSCISKVTPVEVSVNRDHGLSRQMESSQTPQSPGGWEDLDFYQKGYTTSKEACRQTNHGVQPYRKPMPAKRIFPNTSIVSNCDVQKCQNISDEEDMSDWFEEVPEAAYQNYDEEIDDSLIHSGCIIEDFQSSRQESSPVIYQRQLQKSSDMKSCFSQQTKHAWNRPQTINNTAIQSGRPQVSVQHGAMFGPMYDNKPSGCNFVQDKRYPKSQAQSHTQSPPDSRSNSRVTIPLKFGQRLPQSSRNKSAPSSGQVAHTTPDQVLPELALSHRDIASISSPAYPKQMSKFTSNQSAISSSVANGMMADSPRIVQNRNSSVNSVDQFYQINAGNQREVMFCAKPLDRSNAIDSGTTLFDKSEKPLSRNRGIISPTYGSTFRNVETCDTQGEESQMIPLPKFDSCIEACALEDMTDDEMLSSCPDVGTSEVSQSRQTTGLHEHKTGPTPWKNCSFFSASAGENDANEALEEFDNIFAGII